MALGVIVNRILSQSYTEKTLRAAEINMRIQMINFLKYTFTLFLITITLIGCNESKSEAKQEMKNIMNDNNPNYQTATFGSGCFWCTEAIFERVNGVVSFISGYSGGTVEDPTYK